MDIWQQHFSIIDNGLRASVYGNYIGRHNVERDCAWFSIMNMCYAEVVLSWNQLFGQKSQETHWQRLVSQITIPAKDKLKPFNKDMILKYLAMSEAEWSNYHKSMVNIRNVRIAHLNVNHSIEYLPNITKAMHCFYSYREWLTEALHLGNRLGFNIKVINDRASDAVKLYEEQIHRAFNGL